MGKLEPAVRSDALSQGELFLITDLLATAADEFANHSCNDFRLPVTAENRRIGEAIARHQDPEYWDKDNTLADFLAEMVGNAQWVFVYDNWVADYFAALCKRLAAITPTGPLSAAELEVIAEVLESSAEEHKGWYGDNRGDLDITLAPTAEHRALLAAATRYEAPRGSQATLTKLLDATGPISLPDFHVMRYLAARCRAHAAVTDAVSAATILSTPVSNPPQGAAASSAGAMPVIERAGIAPRFPQLERYLKAYFQPFANWQSEQLPLLQLYAAGKAGSTWVHNGKFTTEFVAARLGLHECSRALRWHAVQTALGGASEAVREKKTRIPTPKATLREFADLIENGKHVHLQISPALNAQCFEDILEPEFDPAYAAKADAEISEAEFRIVRHLLLNGHATQHVQQAFLASAPQLAARKGQAAASYVAETMQRVAVDPEFHEWREQRRSAQTDRAAFQRVIGNDWLTPMRRSVAYDYWSCRMAAHSGGQYNYWFNKTVCTATDCLVLGWDGEALGLLRQVQTHLAENRFGHTNDKKHASAHFLLHLITDAQSQPPKGGFEPLFAALLAQWQTPDAEALAPLLLALCDRHTHLAAKTDGPLNLFETYYPFEVLAVLRLRLERGLGNPQLDHPLMNTPLAVLPEMTEFYTDELLEGVVGRARLEYQGL